MTLKRSPILSKKKKKNSFSTVFGKQLDPDSESARKKAEADRLRAAERFMVVGTGEATCGGCGYEYSPKAGVSSSGGLFFFFEVFFSVFFFFRRRRKKKLTSPLPPPPPPLSPSLNIL